MLKVPQFLWTYGILREVKMQNCGLSSAGANEIGKMLHHNNSVVFIDLSENNIGESGVENHIKDNRTLQQINLGANEITAVGTNHLRKLIATDHLTLTSIELSWNLLKDEGISVNVSSLTVTMKPLLPYLKVSI